MIFDFETILDRKGRDALAVDLIGVNTGWAAVPTMPKEGFSAIPMWVADMNFAVPSCIQDAIIERVNHPAFGYFSPSKEYFDSIIRWQTTHNGVEELSADNIGYENGVLGCVASVIHAYTKTGDKVLLHSPTYIGFTRVLEDTGRKAELSKLIQDEDGIWRMDYEDMDMRIKKENIKVCIFCSPHNPCGRVWEKDEIEKAMEVYRANDCVVISDEIWSDLILKGNKHIPTQSVNEDAKQRTVAIYAPSKTFNLAGLVGSYHIIYNKELRDNTLKAAAASHYNGMNVLSMHALIGAYKKEGEEWLAELREVLTNNINYAYDFIKNNFNGVTMAKPEGTYMMFLHCEDYCKSKGITTDELVKAGWDVGVAWQKGKDFHDEWGIRMNFALPFSLVSEALERLKRYVFI